MMEVLHPHSVSIYIETHQHGREVQDRTDRIHLKNCLKEVRKKLEERGVPQEDCQVILDPVQDMLEDHNLWTKMWKGLAIFSTSEGFFKMFKLPYAVQDRVYVDEYFLVTPLARAVNLEYDFFLLSLNRGRVRFYKGDYVGMCEINMSDHFPPSMEAYLRFDEADATVQQHSGNGRMGNAIFHGQGSEKDVEDEHLQRYVNEIVKSLQGWVTDKHAPLILAGEKRMLSEFRNQFKYPHLMEDHIDGNAELMSEDVLWEKCISMLRPAAEEDFNARIEQFNILSARGKTSSDEREVIPAAFYQKIDTLFVSEDATLWGSFNLKDNHLELKPEQTNGEHDMVNAAIGRTLQSGGRVFVTNQNRMPKRGAKLAAVMRY